MYLGSSFLQAQNTGRRILKPPVMFISQVHFLWSIIIASRLSLSHLTVLISFTIFRQSLPKWVKMTSRPRPGWGPKKPSKSMQIDFIQLVPFFSQNMYNVFLNESFWEWFCVLSWTWPARKLTWCHMWHCENISNKTFSFYYTCTWSFIIKQNKMGHFNLQQYKEVKSKMLIIY